MIKLKNKNIFLSVRGYGKQQNVREKSGKSQGISRSVISGPLYLSVETGLVQVKGASNLGFHCFTRQILWKVVDINVL